MLVSLCAETIKSVFEGDNIYLTLYDTTRKISDPTSTNFRAEFLRRQGRDRHNKNDRYGLMMLSMVSMVSMVSSVSLLQGRIARRVFALSLLPVFITYKTVRGLAILASSLNLSLKGVPSCVLRYMVESINEPNRTYTRDVLSTKTKAIVITAAPRYIDKYIHISHRYRLYIWNRTTARTVFTHLNLHHNATYIIHMYIEPLHNQPYKFSTLLGRRTPTTTPTTTTSRRHPLTDIP